MNHPRRKSSERAAAPPSESVERKSDSQDVQSNPAGLEGRVLEMQQTLGNQAVQRFVQRSLGQPSGLSVSDPSAAPGGVLVQRDPPADAPPNNIAQLDELLDKWDVQEGEVIDLLGRMSGPEKATVLSGHYKAAIASALDVGEMTRAVNNLGCPLSVKLEWIDAAATMTRAIDYGEIQGLVQAAPQGERDVLKTVPWRGFFVKVCTNDTMPIAVNDLGFDLRTKLDWLNDEISLDYENVKALITAAPQLERDALKNEAGRALFVGICGNRTMVEAVTDLGWDLATKLDWMVEEGTDVDLVAGVIRLTPAGDLPPVAANAPLMARLASELGTADFVTIQRMLIGGLLGEEEVENTTDTGNEYKAFVAMYRSGITVSKDVEFIEADTFAAGGFEALKARVIAAVTSFLTGKYKVRVASASGTAQEGDGDYPISVSVADNPSADYPLTLHGGQEGRSGVTENGGDIYELGQSGEGSVPDITLAHESSHMVLGASDEYANASVAGRVVHTDNSLMGDFYSEGVAAAEIKARHFQFLVQIVSRYFPGRTVSIVR